MKIKLNIERAPAEPEPPPFICDVCEQECPYWWARHMGEKKLCMLHTAKKAALPMETRVSMNWLDTAQVEAVNSVLAEIRNECSKR